MESGRSTFSGAPGLVRLVLGESESLDARIRDSRARDFEDALVSSLGAERLAPDLLPSLDSRPGLISTRPTLNRTVLFVVYFDEHAPFDLFLQSGLDMLYAHLGAVPLHVYVPSAGTRPFRAMLEEIHLVNGGRPFKSWNLHRLDGHAVREAEAYAAREVERAHRTVESLLPRAQRQVVIRHGNWSLLPYLRLFREDRSVAMFLAAIEYLIMVLHMLMLVTRCRGAGEDPAARDRILAPVCVERTRLSEGRMLHLLFESVLRRKASGGMGGFLRLPAPEAVWSSLGRILDALDTEYRPQRRDWLGVLETVLVVRNQTKGHGVLYFTEDDLVRDAVEVAVEATEALGGLRPAFSFEDGGGLDDLSYVRKWTPDPDDRDAMSQSPVWMEDAGFRFPLDPLIRWDVNSDFYLFAGTSADGAEWYYKNYATGVHVSLLPPGKPGSVES